MKNPKTVRICGLDVDIVHSDPEDWATNGMGRASQNSNRITLRKNMQPDVEAAVFLHEVLHLIADMNELKGIKDDETHIAVLANALNAFLRDNNLKYWSREN